jgi:hypothetical protein
MSGKFAFAAMVIIETDDPRLSEVALIDMAHSNSAGPVATVRRAVLQHLPRDVQRLVAVMPVEQAKQLMLLHEAIGDELGVDIAVRPPAGYMPPTRD